MKSLRIGIDIGGTFTDFIALQTETGTLLTFKLPSTPGNPADAVLSGLQQLLNMMEVDRVEIVHGSTVATNALLERKGAKTALVCTKGFRDVIQIGRQNRPSLYDLFFELPPPIVPEEYRLEVDERVDHTGHVIHALASDDIENTARMGDSAGR